MIKDSGKKGRIELEYYGTEDREALIAALLLALYMPVFQLSATCWSSGCRAGLVAAAATSSVRTLP